MATLRTANTLRNVLYLDAITCFACGALMTLGASPVAAATAIPERLLFGAGASLFPIAAFMAFVAARAVRSLSALAAVIGGNLLWTLASVWLVLGSVIAPNSLGNVFILAQAAVVAGLTVLEIRGATRAIAPDGARV
jgi:hypothetical protein